MTNLHAQDKHQFCNRLESGVSNECVAETGPLHCGVNDGPLVYKDLNIGRQFHTTADMFVISQMLSKY